MELSTSRFHLKYCLLLSQQAHSARGPLVVHSVTPHSVRLLRTSVGPLQRRLPDNTQHSEDTDIHATGIGSSQTYASRM